MALSVPGSSALGGIDAADVRVVGFDQAPQLAGPAGRGWLREAGAKGVGRLLGDPKAVGQAGHACSLLAGEGEGEVGGAEPRLEGAVGAEEEEEEGPAVRLAWCLQL
jgi:hypothetical protein